MPIQALPILLSGRSSPSPGVDTSAQCGLLPLARNCSAFSPSLASKSAKQLLDDGLVSPAHQPALIMLT